MKKNNLFYLIFLLLLGCSPKPKEINYGVDACEWCKMTIVDPKWGAEIVTTKGKVYKFDVIECMIAYYLTNIKNEKDVHSFWTINFLEPKHLLEAKNAFYIRTHEFQSPKGLNVISLKNKDEVAKLPLKEKYETSSWDSVIKIVKEEILE